MNLQQLSQADLERCVEGIPPELQSLLKINGSKLVVAGGFIRAVVAGEKPSDIDVWTNSSSLAYAAAIDQTILLKEAEVHTSPRAHTVRRPNAIPIQFIHQWVFETPEALVESFDFTIAQAALWWDGEKWTSLISDRFYADTEAKRLTYLAPIRSEAVAGSLFRVFKFYKRGYSIDLESLAAVLARATSSDKPFGTILDALREAGSRLPAPPKRCEETSDDIGEPAGLFCGGGSG